MRNRLPKRRPCFGRALCFLMLWMLWTFMTNHPGMPWSRQIRGNGSQFNLVYFQLVEFLLSSGSSTPSYARQNKPVCASLVPISLLLLSLAANQPPKPSFLHGFCLSPTLIRVLSSLSPGRTREPSFGSSLSPSWRTTISHGTGLQLESSHRRTPAIIRRL